MGKINTPIRCHENMRKIINYVRGKYILAGRKPPTISKITNMIAKNTKKEDLLKDVFIEI